MIKLLKSIICFIVLTCQGYFFSKNFDITRRGTQGYIRLNYERNFPKHLGDKEVKSYAIVDIDFDTIGKQYTFSHVHTNETLFRIDIIGDGQRLIIKERNN